MAEDLDNIDEVLHDIFGFLKNNLYAIDTGAIKEVQSNSNKIFEEIQSKIFNLPPSQVKPFVGTLLDRVNEFIRKCKSSNESVLFASFSKVIVYN